MNAIKKLMLLSVLFALVACQGKVDSSKNKTNHPHLEEADHTGPEYTSKYICPMHCPGSGADTMGTCPVCKMDYVLNEKAE